MHVKGNQDKGTANPTIKYYCYGQMTRKILNKIPLYLGQTISKKHNKNDREYMLMRVE
jgi:hypothetical protein